LFRFIKRFQGGDFFLSTRAHTPNLCFGVFQLLTNIGFPVRLFNPPEKISFKFLKQRDDDSASSYHYPDFQPKAKAGK
jgi:hypothetical protein